MLLWQIMAQTAVNCVLQTSVIHLPKCCGLKGKLTKMHCNETRHKNNSDLSLNEGVLDLLIMHN